MLTQSEYVEHGRRAAESYINRQVPLMDSLVKVACEFKLNKHEIDRLVEEANTATYVKLFETNGTDDKYIEFPVAETKKIAEAVEPKMAFSDVSSFSKDYSSPPEIKEASSEEAIRAIFGNVERPELEKKAELIDHVSIDKKRAVRAQLHELSYQFEDKSEDFIKFVKEAAYKGVNPVSLKEAIKTHVDSNIIDALFDQASLHTRESDSLRKVAGLGETTGIVLLASELVNVAKKYVNLKAEHE